MKSVRALLLLPLAMLLAFGPAYGQKIDVSEHKLANGLKILIHEDHDVPNVAMYFFYTVGSRNERPGITGISHYFEHMMFNGAKKYGPKQFDVVMEKNGGANNAYTSRDITAYTDWFPKQAMEVMFDLEADRIENLDLDPKIVESERGVVANERRLGVDNSNGGVLYEQTVAAAFTAHPYGWPVVGWASDIQAWSLEDLQSHFRMGYSPNNCIMVITGDVTSDEVMKLAKKYLEPIPSHEPPPPVKTVEPEQLGERRLVVRRPAQLPLVLAAYHVPEARHADYPALQILGSILAEGRSSRLYKRMVDGDQLVLSVDTIHGPSLDPTLFMFDLSPRTGVKPADAEAALYEELSKVVKTGVTESEVQKAKNIALVAFYDDLRTIAGKANLLGRYQVYFGDYRKLWTAVEDLQKVTAEDVQRVAKQYFGESNRTVGTLIPEDEGGAE
jgi:zinc protease